MENQNEKCSFYKFLFGNSNFKINIYLLLTISSIAINGFMGQLMEILFGHCLNAIKHRDFFSLKMNSLSLIFIGFAIFIFTILIGLYNTNHGLMLYNNYKSSYYSLVLDQEYLWFNKQNLNKLSESIKTDLFKIKGLVNYFNFLYFLIFR